MNYIWEIILRAKENNIPEKDLFFKQSKEYSPYYEQSFLDLDKRYIDSGGDIAVNALYRFDEIFNQILKPDLEGFEELREYLFDIMMHFLSNIDLYSGLSRQEVYCMKIRESISLGEYGLKIKESFKNIDKKEQEYILVNLLKQFKLGSSLSILRDVLKKAYPNMMLYRMKKEDNLILLYLGINKKSFQEERVSLILDLFLPIEYKVRIFWENHFGVVSMNETMTLGAIELF